VHSEAAFEAADDIATVPAFGSWGGDAAEAAKQASEQLRKDLDVHGSEALAVAKAAQRAADDMEQVKSDLAQLEADAADDGFEVDRASSTVMPGPAMQGNMIDLIAAEAKREELQARLNAILWEAARVDEELARAINWPPELSRSPKRRMTTVGVEDTATRRCGFAGFGTVRRCRSPRHDALELTSDLTADHRHHHLGVRRLESQLSGEL
jgi:hypothetical protein